MKTRISKRLLSVLLAALMVVTSLPLVTINAFAAADPNTVEGVQEAMDAFEQKLESPGAFTNVDVAYQAYVNCQKALDAYIYGGETNALNGKAQALNEAVGNIDLFVTKKAHAIPYPYLNTADGDSRVAAHVNSGNINQILYAERAVLTNGVYAAQAAFKMCYNPNTVVLYDTFDNGRDPIPQIRIPISVNAYKSNGVEPDNQSGTNTAYNKTRHLYACYPSNNQAGTEDDLNWRLVGYWRSGAGDNGDWGWDWDQNNSKYDPAYSVETGSGQLGNQSTTYRSDDLAVNRSGNFFSYKYTSVQRYHSNIMTYVGAAPTGSRLDTTIPYWYCATGESANSSQDDKSMGGQSITIINYDYVTNAIVANGSKMKSVDLGNFSEGGLKDYINAMEAATDWDPNTYFNGANNIQNCTIAMSNIVTAMNQANTTNTNSTSYAALRTAMDDTVRTVFANGNVDPNTNKLRYTADSWSGFETAYNDAKAIMAACNDSDTVGAGYGNAQAAAKAQALVDAFGALDPNTAKVETAALMAAIARVQVEFNQLFTDATWNPLVAKCQEAIAAVWIPDGTEQEGETVYGVKAKALDLTDENQAIVDGYVAEINQLIKNLRFSMDVVVTTTEGKYSMNSALALANNITDPSYYGNYSVFSTAVANANTYKNDVVPYQEMTDYAGQYATLKEEIAKVVRAYNSLTKAFTRIDDGELANAGQIADLSELYQGRNKDRYAYKFQFSYPTNVILFKTTHQAKTYRYGDALIRYTINLDDNVSKENNCLDSITINTDQNGNGDAAVSGEFTSTPKELSGAQKTAYAACLAADGFSLNNFRFHSQANNSKDFLGVDNSGTKFNKDAANASEKIYECLSQTNGERAFLANGGIFVQPSLKKDALVTLAADFCIDTPATVATTLDEETLPDATTYTLSNKYVGAVYCWNVQPSGAWAGYGFFSYKDTDEPINSVVTVVDISYLIDLINQCNLVANDGDLYTLGTWTTFQQKLVAAQANMNYTALTADQIKAQCQQRYTELLAAYEALELRAFNTSIVSAVNEYRDLFNTNNADGTYTEESWTNFVTAFTEASSKIASGAIYSTENIKTIPATQQSTIDAIAQALHTAKGALVKVADIAADWRAYNIALQNLRNLLVDNALSVETLQAVVSGTRDMLYTFYTAAQQAAENGSIQPKINSETQALTALYNTVYENAALITALKGTDAYGAAEAYATTYKATYGNDDMWNGANSTFTYTSPVNVPLVNDDIDGMLYTDVDTLDAAIRASMNAKSIREYTIYLNGKAIGTAQYGEPIIVDSDATPTSGLHHNAPDTDVNSETAAKADWFYSYAAPSNGFNQSNEKYILSAPSYGFIVKGDTYLSTKTVDNTDTNLCIKFYASVGGKNRLFDVKYTNEAGQAQFPALADLPTYAGYTVNTADISSMLGKMLDFDADTKIIIKYTPDTEEKYGIGFYDGFDAFEADELTDTYYASYNDLVVMPTEQEDVYCWAVSEYMCDYDDYENGDYEYELKIVHYGPSYSFYACEDILDFDDGEDYGYSRKGIVALTYDGYKDVLYNTVTSGNFAFVGADGNYVIPAYDGYSGSLNDSDIPVAVPAVTNLENVIDINDSTGKLEKFSLIGTFILPEGYEMVETGFLFTKNVDVSIADMVIENVNKDDMGIARMKSSRYTVGDQFVVNVKAPKTATSFQYIGYAVVTHKDKDNNVITETIYSSTLGGETNYGG